MLDIIITVFVGWPAILTTIVLVSAGLLRREYRFLVAAAILALPFSWFLSGFPLIRSPFYLVPLIPFSAAFALRRGYEMMAWILGVIYFLAAFLVFMAVLAGIG